MKNWYIMHVYSGKELDIKKFLQEKIVENNYIDFFGEILVPMENVLSKKDGKNINVKKKMFPGYILIEMVMNDNLWFFVKNIPFVLGFVSDDSGYPLVVNQNEAELVLKKVKGNYQKPVAKIFFKKGETVRISNGPFSDLSGMVEEINYDKNKLCVFILIFGRYTLVDLRFDQVEKI